MGAGAAGPSRRWRARQIVAPRLERELAIAGRLVTERAIVVDVAGRLEEHVVVGEVAHGRVGVDRVADRRGGLVELLVAIEREPEAPLGELPLERARLGEIAGAAIAADRVAEAAERHQGLGGVAVEDRARAGIVPEIREPLGVDEADRAIVLGERLGIAAQPGEREAELLGDGRGERAAGVERAGAMELLGRALTGAGAAALGMIRIAHVERAGEREVRLG